MSQVYDPSALGLHITKAIGNELQCMCPYHDDSRPSAEYNPDKGIFFCFTCKTTRSATDLAKDLGGELVKVSRESVVTIKYDEGSSEDWKSIVYRNRFARSNPYLDGRRVTPHQIDEYAIKQNKDGVIIPFINKFDELSGAVIRHYERQPKYYFYGEKPLIWPISSLYHQGEVIVTEGVFGALRAERADFKAIAILGTNSIGRVSRLLKANPHIKPIIWMDPDYAGALAAGKFILNGFEAVIHEENIDEMSPQKIKKALETKRTRNIMELIYWFNDDGRLKDTLWEYWKKLENNKN